MSNYQVFSKLFPISFISAIVFNFYVQVKTAFTSVNFRAVTVRANKTSLDFLRCPSDMLLPHLLLLMPIQ